MICTNFNLHYNLQFRLVYWMVFRRFLGNTITFLKISNLLPLKEGVSLRFNKTCFFFTQNCFVLSFIRIGLVVLTNRLFLSIINERTERRTPGKTWLEKLTSSHSGELKRLEEYKIMKNFLRNQYKVFRWNGRRSSVGTEDFYHCYKRGSIKKIQI